MRPRIEDLEAMSGSYLLKELRERGLDPLPRTDEKASE